MPKLKGVSYYRRTHRWQAQICIQGVHLHLGYFETPERAHEVYLSAGSTKQDRLAFLRRNYPQLLHENNA